VTSTETPTGTEGGTNRLWRWQRDALEAWLDHGRRGVVEAVTGSGKTDLAIAAIADARRRGRFVLVIVPSRVLMEQWYERLTRAFPEVTVGRLGDAWRDKPRDCDILVSTRHSASSQKPVPPGDGGGLLVADECHGYGGSVLRKSLLKPYEDRLGLTATLERSDDAVDTVILPFFGGVCFRYDFGRAIDDGVCAEPRVALVAVPLTEEERREYDATEGRIVAARRVLRQIPGVPHEPFGDFLAAVQHLAANDAGPDGKAANDYLDAFGSRREIVATSSAKYETLSRFAPSIRDSAGSLLFTETVRAANHAIVRLDDEVAIEIITGDTPRNERRHILERLRSGELHAVAAPRVLDEGVDVPDANLGIVVSASRTRRQMIERMGRVLRRKQLGSGARFVIIFAADTLEDPRLREDRDGFLDEIERIAESTRIFRPGDDESIATFLDYSGPETVRTPITVDPAEVAELCLLDRSHVEPPDYLEVAEPIEPTVRTPRVKKPPKPRLSTGERPVVVEAVGKEWVLRCTGCGTVSEPTPYRWQALDRTVDCTCDDD